MIDSERPPVVLVNRCIILDESNRMLLLRRSADDGRNPGKWEFPGGKEDVGETKSDALNREVFEETNLHIEQEPELIHIEENIITSGRHNGSSYIASFSVARSMSGNFKLSVEHDDYAWEQYDDALGYDLTQESRNALVKLGKSVLKCFSNS
jgi:8-oxo-dGTP diphosphatase